MVINHIATEIEDDQKTHWRDRFENNVSIQLDGPGRMVSLV